MANFNTKSLTIISVLIVLLMIFSGFYGAFSSGAITHNSKSHIYFVTEAIGGTKYSYYEEVRNGTVVKTWPAPSTFQGNFSSNLGSAGQSSPDYSKNFYFTTLELSSSQQSVAKLTPLDSHLRSFLVSISPTSATMDIGQSITFTASTSSSGGLYSYQWYVNNKLIYQIGPIFNTTSNYTFTPSGTGSFTIYVTVTNWFAFKQSTSNTATVTVNPALSISAQPQSYSIDQGQPFTALSSTVEYGTSPYSWQWYYSSNSTAVSRAFGRGTTASYTPNAAGSYYVVFTDSSPTPATVTSTAATVTVNPALSISISPSSATFLLIDVGQTLTLTATASGGTPPYTY